MRGVEEAKSSAEQPVVVLKGEMRERPNPRGRAVHHMCVQIRFVLCWPHGYCFDHSSGV